MKIITLIIVFSLCLGYSESIKYVSSQSYYGHYLFLNKLVVSSGLTIRPIIHGTPYVNEEGVDIEYDNGMKVRIYKVPTHSPNLLLLHLIENDRPVSNYRGIHVSDLISFNDYNISFANSHTIGIFFKDYMIVKYGPYFKSVSVDPTKCGLSYAHSSHRRCKNEGHMHRDANCLDYDAVCVEGRVVYKNRCIESLHNGLSYSCELDELMTIIKSPKATLNVRSDAKIAFNYMYLTNFMAITNSKFAELESRVSDLESNHILISNLSVWKDLLDYDKEQFKSYMMLHLMNLQNNNLKKTGQLHAMDSMVSYLYQSDDSNMGLIKTITDNTEQFKDLYLYAFPTVDSIDGVLKDLSMLDIASYHPSLMVDDITLCKDVAYDCVDYTTFKKFNSSILYPVGTIIINDDMHKELSEYLTKYKVYLTIIHKHGYNDEYFIPYANEFLRSNIYLGIPKSVEYVYAKSTNL